MCLSYCSFYLDMLKQLQPCERNTKECLKDEQGWFDSLMISLKIKISRRLLADYVKRLHQKACCTCGTIIIPHSANQIIDSWRCRCCRHFLNSLIASRIVGAFKMWFVIKTKEGLVLLQTV